VAYTVRPARTGDVRAIRGLINVNLASGRLLDKPTVTLYEDVQEFVVATGPPGDQVIGCGALQVMWEDLAEIRTIAVAAARQGQGIGASWCAPCYAGRARSASAGYSCSPSPSASSRYGFEPISGAAADPDVSDPEVFAELLRSGDEGVAEFLDLDRVKPSTLGNTRMLLSL
jgi:amino-acid N-acetyltransferase